MKKVLSLLIALTVAVSSFTVCVNAFAAPAGCVSIAVSGTVNGAAAKEALDAVNAERAANGLAVLAADASLTAVAEQRAAEIMLFADKDNETRPDGSAITTAIPDYKSTSFTAYEKLSDNTAATLKNAIAKLSSLDYKSVGLSSFTYQDVTVYYLICSKNDSAAPAAFSTREQSFEVNVASSNLSSVNIVFNVSNNKRYNLLSTEFTPSGAYRKAIVIPNEQLVYSSSNAKIYKVVGSNGYVKKNGSFTVSVSLADGTALASEPLKMTGFNKVKINDVAAYSTKKKTVKVHWSKNITDANGYQIQYSTNKKFKKNNKFVTVKGRKNVKKVIKKLKSKKTYYIRVRAYVTQDTNEKVYSNWSKTVKVKVK